LWGERDADRRLLPPLLLSRSLPDDVRALPLSVLGTNRFVKLLILLVADCAVSERSTYLGS